MGGFFRYSVTPTELEILENLFSDATLRSIIPNTSLNNNKKDAEL